MQSTSIAAPQGNTLSQRHGKCQQGPWPLNWNLHVHASLHSLFKAEWYNVLLWSGKETQHVPGIFGIAGGWQQDLLGSEKWHRFLQNRRYGRCRDPVLDVSSNDYLQFLHTTDAFPLKQREFTPKNNTRQSWTPILSYTQFLLIWTSY